MHILSDSPQRLRLFGDKAHPKSAAHARSMGNGKRALGDLPRWGSRRRASCLAYVDAHLWARTKPGQRGAGVQNQPMIMYTHSAPNGSGSRLFCFLHDLASLAECPRLPTYFLELGSGSRDVGRRGTPRSSAVDGCRVSCGQCPWARQDGIRRSETRSVAWERGCVSLEPLSLLPSLPVWESRRLVRQPEISAGLRCLFRTSAAADINNNKNPVRDPTDADIGTPMSSTSQGPSALPSFRASERERSRGASALGWLRTLRSTQEVDL